MSTTYRVEQWTREGQILRAEYVDENGQPYTLRRALEDVDNVRGAWADSAEPTRSVQFRIVNTETGTPVDEAEARNHWWLHDRGAIYRYVESTHELAEAFADVADALRAHPDAPTEDLSVAIDLQVLGHATNDEDVRRKTIDAVATALGLTAELRRLSASYAQYYAGGPSLKIYGSVSPESVDKAELTARAVLQPSLPDDAEAGIADEGALGIPGLTEAEADDFMGGAA